MNFLFFRSHSVKVILFILLILIDQYSKILATQNISIRLNDGISFGLLSEQSSIVVVVFIAIILILAYRFFKSIWVKNPVAGVLFFAGAVSNFIDRLVVGSVRDWLPLPGFGIYNNLADWYIALAIIMIIGEELHSYSTRKKAQ